jgi:hypothetical protein
LPMPQSPTASPSVITVENTDGIIMSKSSCWKKNFQRAPPSVIPSVFRRYLVFFISDQISDGTRNFRRSIF